MKKFFLRVLFFVLLTTYHLQLTTLYAETSVNIPIHDSAYEDLEALNAAGLIDSSGLSTKPISRMEAARLINKAILLIQAGKKEFSLFEETRARRAEEALNRLVEEFRRELLRFGVTEVAKDDEPVKDVRFKLLGPIRTQTVYADLQDAEELSYENQRGLTLKDGFNSRSRMSSWFEYKDFFSFWLEPSLKISEDTQDFEIETGYVKFSLRNVEIEAGRDTLWWGPGYHGSMLLSDNAYPLDMVKLSNAHPFILPWGYEALGKWNMDFFVAELGKKRDFPEAYLSGMRIEMAPCDYFTFGVSRTAIFGGEGRPGMDAGDYWDIFTTRGKNELSQDVQENLSDQKAGIDFKLNIPWDNAPWGLCASAQLYGEWAGEDKFAPWENEAPGYLIGLLASDVFRAQGIDLRAEYARTNSSWYTHGIYTSGYTHKGGILGHHMGRDADDLFVRFSRDFPSGFGLFERLRVGGQFDYEAHLRSEANPERKYEFAVDGAFHLSDTRSIKLLYEHERYRNFGNVSGKRSSNNIFEITGEIRF